MSVCSSPINDQAHTVPQKCCFWGEIRGKISQARTIQRKKSTFDTHNRGRWTHWCNMSENIFSTLGTRLGVHWGVPMLSPPPPPRETTGDNGRHQRETATGDRGNPLKNQRETENSKNIFFVHFFLTFFFSKNENFSFAWEAFSHVFRSVRGRFDGSSPVRLPCVSRLSPVCLPLSPVGAVVSTCVRRIYTAFAARGSVH